MKALQQIVGTDEARILLLHVASLLIVVTPLGNVLHGRLLSPQDGPYLCGDQPGEGGADGGGQEEVVGGGLVFGFCSIPLIIIIVLVRGKKGLRGRR